MAKSSRTPFPELSCATVENMLKARFLQALAIGFLVLYLGVAFAGWFNLDSISGYAEYGFEVVFVILVFGIYRNWEWKKEPLGLGAGVTLFFALAAGFAAYEFTDVLGYVNPFNLKDPETVIFLLAIGPLLEELVFRGALWKLIEVVTGSSIAAFLFAAVAFSYAHYHVIQFVDASAASFIRYQAIYTLALGLFCGGMRMLYGFRAAWLTHLAFNFGFWIAVGVL